MTIAGRKEEITLLLDLLKRDRSEFLAMYGRRRIGKTFLIREVYKPNIIFECSGLHQQDMELQLSNFINSLNIKVKNHSSLQVPKNWLEAFNLLKNHINNFPSKQKKVIFLDEISWFETPRAGFLSVLDNFWNQFCSKRNDIILVICGSAASWIINKVINNRGGLHNRITTHIKLMPFTLYETKDYLNLNKIKLSDIDICSIFMAAGGVPYYLKDIKKGQGVPQILDNLFFNKTASLKKEFSNLYAALFNNSHLHEKVVKALASKGKGLTRGEIIKATKITSGGGLSIILKELLECGFITQSYPINKPVEDSIFRLIDEYTLFYFKFIIHNKNKNSWQLISRTHSYKIWLGFAFENICFKHVAQIKKALGINGIISHESSWAVKANDINKGAQIDLLIDRADNCINIIEAKFYSQPFQLTKAYAAQLQSKTHIFINSTKTKKNVFTTLVTTYGLVENTYSNSIITNQILVEELFNK
jgi:uncharacterized protein